MANCFSLKGNKCDKWSTYYTNMDLVWGQCGLTCLIQMWYGPSLRGPYHIWIRHVMPALPEQTKSIFVLLFFRIYLLFFSLKIDIAGWHYQTRQCHDWYGCVVINDCIWKQLYKLNALNKSMIKQIYVCPGQSLNISKALFHPQKCHFIWMPFTIIERATLIP